MYTAYFGMKENPFGLTPDPKYIFWSRPHQEALAHLLYGVRERKGFILLTGEVGTGKTLLCRCLMEALGDRVRTALILNPVHSADQLLRRVNEDLGVDSDPSGTEKPLDRLNAFLLEEYARGRNCVLTIDETQTLPLDVVEQVRLVSNLETERNKLIQIVLVGQEELNDMLRLHSMRQLRGRIAVAYHLRRFDERDTAGYIRHRLRTAARAGGRGVRIPPPAPRDPVEFTPGAAQAVYRFTGGNPRQINILCDRALLAAYSSGRPVVDRGIVLAASREMVGHRPSAGRGWGALAGPRWPRRLAWAFAACAGLVTGFLAGRMWGWP